MLTSMSEMNSKNAVLFIWSNMYLLKRLIIIFANVLTPQPTEQFFLYCSITYWGHCIYIYIYIYSVYIYILTGWGQPKKTLRTVDGLVLRVVKKAYHLHVFLRLANLNIQNSWTHSKIRLGKAELSRPPVFGAHAASRTSHRQQDQNVFSFTSCCTWTNKYKLQFKHANRKRCERAQFSTHVRCSVRTGRMKRDASQSA